MTDSLSHVEQLYKGMLRIRLVEEAIAGRYHEQQMRCPVHLSIGQEGVATGVCAHLQSDDSAVSTHRSHAHYLAKGGDLKAMIAELYGKKSGCTSGKGGSMHLVDLSCGFFGAVPIVGSTIPIGTGLGLSAFLSGESKVAAVFLGEGACEEGVFHESINFAVLKNLPIVYVCENNLYSVYTPLDQRQSPSRKVLSLAAGHGMKTYDLNGNDVDEVSNSAKEAIEYARAGKGPVFLECATYRWREHCGPNFDNDIGYRTEEEFLSWKAKCPLEHSRKQIQDFSQDWHEELCREITEEIDAAFEFALKDDFPDQDELKTNIFAE